MKLSFVVPAHNEESLIDATVRSIDAAAKASGRDYEIIVVDDASTDGTAKVAEAAGATVLTATCRQIAGTRNTGARAATGDILLFVDADTMIGANIVLAVIDSIQRGAIGGGAHIQFDPPIPMYAKILLPIVQATNKRIGILSGCFLFCTRSAFDAVGGYNETVYAAEEAFFSRALKREGPIITLNETVVTSGRKLRTYSAWELLSTLARLALRGTRGVRHRENLSLWYGPRREDPKQ